MKKRNSSVIALVAAAALGAAVTAFAVAEPAKETKPAAGAGAPPEMPLPPGWTEADAKAAMAAMTPGEMQAKLAKDAGTWTAKSTFWMAPGAEPMVTTHAVTDTAIMDGRFLQSEWKGEMTGMGTFTGLGLKGYDNAAKRFVSTWADNWSTGIMAGTGVLSDDGKTITWTFGYTCPLTKKPCVMRQIETWKSDTSKTLEMWGTEPKSGKEYKMMFFELTKK